ncbi:MAG TPA: hypothetical protein VF188_01965 [Longimicrobiales bacterium]
MKKGRDFLREQVHNAVMQHRELVEAVDEHRDQAQDPRFRELCARWLPTLREHQRRLEEYSDTLGGADGLKKAIGTLVGTARAAVDAMRESDFLRLVGDIIATRQAQDTFATFAAAGDRIGEPRLAEIGRAGERSHDDMQRDFNRLAQDLFVEHTTEGGARAPMAAD